MFKRIKLTRLFLVLFTLIVIGTNGYLIHTITLLNNIENIGRYLLIVLLAVIDIFVITEFYNLISNKTKNKHSYIIFIVLITIFFVFNVGCGYYIKKIYKSIDNVNKDYTVYSTSIITLKESKLTSISDIRREKVGITSNTASISSYQISMDIINDEKLKDIDLIPYDNLTKMVKDLYNKKIDAIFIDSDYVGMFDSITGFEKIADETKEIYSKEKKIDKILPSNKNINEPFTVLLMGVDSTKDGLDANVSANGDSLILITFNPKTLTATMLSIPRDSYVPIACFKNHQKSKITHAAWQGASCMTETIENLFDIDIDYYVKMNFKGVVKLVDALGGIEVDVPYSFCEQNSNRRFGKDTVYVEKGLQLLNGEQALALARNRHPNPTHCSSKWTNYSSNDFVRNKNQQMIITAILNKAKSINTIDQMTDLLNTVSKNLDTNFSTNQILSFYNILKSIIFSKADGNTFNIESMVLRGKADMIYEPSMDMELWSYVLSDKSVSAVKNAMHENLGLIKPSMIKEFNYSINEPYEIKKIGEI